MRPTRVCAQCGETLHQSTWPTKLYCSEYCKTHAQLLRKKARAMKAPDLTTIIEVQHSDPVCDAIDALAAMLLAIPDAPSLTLEQATVRARAKAALESARARMRAEDEEQAPEVERCRCGGIHGALSECDPPVGRPWAERCAPLPMSEWRPLRADGGKHQIQGEMRVVDRGAKPAPAIVTHTSFVTPLGRADFDHMRRELVRLDPLVDARRQGAVVVGPPEPGSNAAIMRTHNYVCTYCNEGWAARADYDAHACPWQMQMLADLEKVPR